MAKERSLVFVKPGNFQRSLEIFCCLDELLGEGTFTKTMPVHIYRVPEEVVRQHYAHTEGQLFYGAQIQAFVNGDVVLTVYEGEKIIGRIRTAVGNTNPQKADSRTVRKIFANVDDSFDDVFGASEYLNNFIH